MAKGTIKKQAPKPVAPKKKAPKKKTKAEQIAHFTDEFKIVVKMECSICGDDGEYERDLFGEEPAEVIKAGGEHFYNEGWRYDTSSVFAQIGIMCPTCTKNKDNEKHFEY